VRPRLPNRSWLGRAQYQRRLPQDPFAPYKTPVRVLQHSARHERIAFRGEGWTPLVMEPALRAEARNQQLMQQPGIMDSVQWDPLR